MKSYKKLVRDEIPKIISDNGEYFYTRKLKQDEFIYELKRKLLEEVLEVDKCTSNKELKEELADVIEVMMALCNATNISIDKKTNTPLKINLNKELIDHAYNIKRTNDINVLKEELTIMYNIVNALINVNDISYQDVEDMRLSKKEARGGFDRKVFLDSTIDKKEMKNMRGCKTCVNRNCHNPLNHIYGDVIDGEPAGKYCIDYVSKYKQKGK